MICKLCEHGSYRSYSYSTSGVARWSCEWSFRRAYRRQQSYIARPAFELLPTIHADPPLSPLKSPIKTTSVSVGGKKRRASSGYRVVTSSPFCRISASSSIKRIDSQSSRTARIDLPLFEIRETKRVGRSYCYCCAALDMAQVQRERNLREMNSPSTCGPRRAATIVSVIGRGCQVWVSLRIQHRYRSLARSLVYLSRFARRRHAVTERRTVFFTPTPIRPARPASSV